MNPVQKSSLILPVLILMALLVGFTTGCSAGEAEMEAHKLEIASLAEMPAGVQSAPVSVQQAYQFAAANPDILQELPCYCGCGSMGHTSNYACYISGQDTRGETVFDTHALGCSICVDITQDAMRLLKEGKSLPEIRMYVDETYARYGPSNIP